MSSTIVPPTSTDDALPFKTVVQPAPVLLVDDQPARLLTYEAILQPLNVDCVAVHSGFEALERLLWQEFAAIVLDISMPAMDGFETAKRIREHPRVGATPIIFVTGLHVSDFERLKGYEIGAIDFIGVPIVPEILRSKVAVLVELHQRRGELQVLNRALEEARGRLAVEHAKAVADSELHRRAVFEHPSERTIVLEALRDMNGAVVDFIYRNANGNALKMLGESLPTLIGKRISEVFEPERADRARTICSQVLLANEATRYESEFGGRDFLVTVFPIGRDCVVSSGIDITDRKRTERALRASERRYEALLASAPVGVAHIALDGRFEYVNAAFCRLVGYTVEELLNLTWEDITHPDDRAKDAELAQQVLARKLPHYILEKRYLRKDGSIVWVNLFGNFVFDDTGAPIMGVAVAVDITERRQAEQRLAAVLHSIDDHLVCYDHQWRYTYLNDGAARILGRTPDELLGRCVWELFPDAVGNQYYRELHAAAAERRVIVSEHNYTTWDRWYENHIYPSADGVTVFSADITARKQAEQALRESERWLSLAKAAARLGVYDWNLEAGQLLWDGRTYELWGADAMQPTSYDVFFSALHPDDREQVQQAIEHAMDFSGDGHYSASFRVLPHNGAPMRWIEAAGKMIFDNGRAVRLVGTVQDTTERKFAEARLRESEARFRQLANSIDQFAWTCDELGFATWYNDRWYEYTGTTPAEMAGDGWRKVHDPEHVDRVLSHLRDCVAKGVPWEDTFPLRGKDGTYRWFLSRAVPFRDTDGRIIRWFGTNTDVTELRRLQEALKDADRRKDEFLAMLAHELRNPIAPIRNAADVLAKTAPKDAQHETLIGVVQRQTAQLARLLDDLLDVARISRGRIELRREIVSLRSCIDAAIETVEPLSRDKGHRLTVEPSPEAIYVSADSARLTQCIANLLANAVKYTDSGGDIRVVTSSKNGEASIEVVDNGIGIAADFLPQVFDLFAQSDASLDRSQGGLGVGLSICKRLMEMHGGSISAHSKGLTQGSTFTLRLPCVEDAASVVPQSAPLPAARRRVLIVDDNQDAADTLGMLLQFSGHTTEIAYSGEQALQVAESFNPEVVFLDIGLPRMNGYEVAKRMRVNLGPSTRLIALSGYGQASDRARSAEAGFDAHLVKPIDGAAIEQLLAEQ